MMTNSYFSKSLEKGLKILSLFNYEHPSLTQTEIAKELSLNKTSTYRYINTLIEMGFLEKDVSSKRLRPSIYCLAFCNNLMRATDHRKMIKALVDEVHSRFNVTIDVALAVDNDLMRIYNRQASDMLTFNLPDFARNCLHNTALGKAFLSTLPAEELRQKVDGLNLTSKTSQTIVDQNKLLKELLETKSRGYSLAREEYLHGLISIAAPIINPHNRKGIGAVSFDFPVIEHDLTTLIERFSSVIMNLAREISSTLPLEYDYP